MLWIVSWAMVQTFNKNLAQLAFLYAILVFSRQTKIGPAFG